MSSQFARDLVVEQRRRLIGNLMAYCEREVFPKLTEAERKALREKVQQAVGGYHELVLDMLKVTINDGMLVNDQALRLLEDIHAATRSGRRG